MPHIRPGATIKYIRNNTQGDSGAHLGAANERRCINNKNPKNRAGFDSRAHAWSLFESLPGPFPFTHFPTSEPVVFTPCTVHLLQRRVVKRETQIRQRSGRCKGRYSGVFCTALPRPPIERNALLWRSKRSPSETSLSQSAANITAKHCPPRLPQQSRLHVLHRRRQHRPHRHHH